MSRRVGYVLLSFPLISETFVENEIRAVLAHDFDVFLVSTRAPMVDRAAPTVLPPDRLTYRPSPSQRRRAVLRWLCRRPIAFMTNVAVALRQRSETMLRASADAAWVADVYRKAEVEQIHAHFATEPAAVAMAAARLLDVPFTFTIHAMDLYVRTAGLCAKARAAARVVTVCDYNIEQLRQRCPALDPVSIARVYCGVDTSEFTLRGPVDPSPTVRLLSVGRLVPKKGFDDLIRAVALLTERGVGVDLRIIGEGRQRPDLEALIAELDLAEVVHLLGLQPNDSVREAMATTDVFVLACVVDEQSDRDSMPVVIKEAMAVGVPIVATDEVGNPEMVDDAVGRLVPPHDPVALADALASLAAAGEDERRRLGLAARARAVERFDLHVETAKLVSVFDEVLGEHRGAR